MKISRLEDNSLVVTFTLALRFHAILAYGFPFVALDSAFSARKTTRLCPLSSRPRRIRARLRAAHIAVPRRAAILVVESTHPVAVLVEWPGLSGIPDGKRRIIELCKDVRCK